MITLRIQPVPRIVTQWSCGLVPEEPGPGEFFIPHSLAVMEDQNLLCVADRENGRVQCFDLEGNFKFFIKHSQFGSRLFAVEYCPKHGEILSEFIAFVMIEHGCCGPVSIHTSLFWVLNHFDGLNIEGLVSDPC